MSKPASEKTLRSIPLWGMDLDEDETFGSGVAGDATYRRE
jgi:hypothetical protein